MKFVLLLSFLVSMLAFGQGNLEKNRFELGATITKAFGYRILENNDTGPTNDFVLDQRNEIEVPKFCYSAGITIAYKLNKSARISSSIIYANKGYRTKKLTLEPVFSDPASPNAVKTYYSMNYIDVPLLFHYRWGKEKWQFSIGAGITANIFINEIQRSMIYYENEIERKSQESQFDYNLLNLSPQVEFGVLFDAHERFYFSARPTFSYGLLKVSDTPITAYLYTGGIRLGIHIK